LVFWLLVGLAVTSWYDRSGKDRMGPELMAFVHQSAATYRARSDGSAPDRVETGQPNNMEPS
jgi:hypothetical protein